MTRHSLRASLVVFLGVSAPRSAWCGEPPWIQLFDGKTLTGWVQRGGAAHYEARDGAIVGTSAPNTPNSFLCTERTCGDFVLELEFKVDAELNSGIQIRGQSHPGYQNGRVHGYQVEIDPDTKRGRLWSGGIYDEGRRGWLADLAKNDAARKAFKPGDWNKVRVEAMGESLKTWINGVPAADLVDSTDLEGFIGLQVHGVRDRKDPLRVAWRNIRLQDHGRRAWLPLVNGKDLRGFRTTGGGQWTVEGGALVGAMTKAETRDAVLFVEKPLADFTARIEYRLAAGSSGLYFRAKASEGPAGVQGPRVDVNADKGMGGLYEAGGRQSAVPSEMPKSFRPGDWNWVTVSARGSQAVAYLNQVRVASVDDKAASSDGQLALALPAAQDARLEVRRFEVLSGVIPPPVAGFPIGWCIRVQGTAPEDAKTAGFEYLELALQDVLNLSDEDFEGTAARLRALGIPALTGYNLVPNDLKVVGPDVDRARQDEHLRRALARVARLGVRFVILGSGKARHAPDGFSRDEAFRQLADFGRRLSQEAEKHGLTVLVQPLRSEDTNMINTVADAVGLVKAVDRANFQILVDYSFMVLQKEDPSVLLKARKHLRHVQISNPAGRVYPMDAREADYASFFRALEQIGYRGGISVHARTDLFAADAPRAIAFLRWMAAAITPPPRP